MQQLDHEAGAFQQVLQVVQHEQHTLVPQVAQQLPVRRLSPKERGTYRLRRGGGGPHRRLHRC
jgi:hypothetical protein